MSTVPSKPSVYESITANIVAAIKVGGLEYRTPWHTSGTPLTLPANAATHAEYRGINILALWIEALQRSYVSGLWASYRQWQALGAQVRKGERGSMIVFYKRIEETAFEDDDPDRDVRLRHIARASHVFNLAQVDGYSPPDESPRSTFECCQEAEAFVGAVGAEIQHGLDHACYRRSADIIEMPARDRFVGTPTSSPAEAYYATLLHELTHWTGAPHRLAREFGKRFGDEAYAMEELVAELGAAFGCAALGIANDPRTDHAAYIAHWLAILKQDNRAIFTAASKAQEAFEHLAHLATRSDGQ
jgi:antirestriction protein ArdC